MGSTDDKSLHFYEPFPLQQKTATPAAGGDS